MELDTTTRVYEAKKFLNENSGASVTTVARIFHLPRSTLERSIAREAEKGPIPNHSGGHNLILKEHQTMAIHDFIRSLLTSSMPPTKPLIFNAIRNLKLKENSNFQGPSKRWFQKWWKANKLHTIKTKPLATARYTAADTQEIMNWFKAYRTVLRNLNITKRQNIVNFDEQGVRIGCMKRQEIIVPEDVLEFYALSPENRQSLMIFEIINAAGEFPPPPMMVIQGQQLMEAWFSDDLPAGTRVLTSENGFTSDKIAMEFLQHFIEDSDAGPDADWKLMLMDNHGSHITPEFALLADENHIRPYPLIPHLTHCMQPLDVGVFQPYKHWYDVAIQNAMAEFNLEYSMARFCRDLIEIRINTFKKSTIQSAFEKCGMYPPDSTKCIALFQKFVPTGLEERSRKNGPSLSAVRSAPITDLELPRLRPTTLHEVEVGLDRWKSKIDASMQWSDPLREEELSQYVSHTRKVIADSHLKDYELSLHQKRRHDELLQKTTSRKRLKPIGGVLGITKEDALKAIANKREKEDETARKREHNNFMRIWRMERDELQAKGVIARKAEKARLKRVKDCTKRGVEVPEEDVAPITDPEMEWKASNPTWLAEVARKANAKKKHQIRANQGEEEEDYEDIIIDTVGDSNVRDALLANDDFVAFEDSESDEDVQLFLGPDRALIPT